MVYVILFVLLLGLAGLLLLARRSRTRRTEEIDRRFSGARVMYRDDAANFFGQRSRGLKQIRGNGILVVTDAEIYFAMLLPNRKIRIPLESVLRIETPSSFLGKSIFRPLLQVEYVNEKGETDAAAWYVQDLARCETAIQAAMSPGGSR